jgi:hypothetical protein
MGSKVERLVAESNALKETIKNLESRDEETMATLQKENEELKKKNIELDSREAFLVARDRAVKRLEHRLEDARIVSSNWEVQVVWFVGF